jgi:hypothetical protein
MLYTLLFIVKIRYMFGSNWISTGVQVLQCGPCGYCHSPRMFFRMLPCCNHAIVQFNGFVGRICLLLRCMTVFHMFVCSIRCKLLCSRLSFSFCYFLRTELCTDFLSSAYLNSSLIPILIILTFLMKPLIILSFFNLQLFRLPNIQITFKAFWYEATSI